MKKRVKKGSWFNLQGVKLFTKYGINTAKPMPKLKQPK